MHTRSRGTFLDSGPDATSDRDPAQADARRNHERVVAAAVEVFREKGVQATAPEIATRAQVGKATVYRSFPTKEDLLESITRLSLGGLDRRVAAATQTDDPYEAFCGFVHELFDPAGE